MVSISQRQRSARGFTLMEVMLATAIAAIVLIAIQTVFFSALRLRTTTATRIDEATEVQHAVSIIRRDLTSLVGTGGSFFAGLQTSAASNIAETEGERASPDFFTATGGIDERSTFGDVQCVAYSLHGTAGGDTPRTLVRLISRNLLPTQPENPVEETILHGVRSLSFEYYDGESWANDWDSTTTTTMPTAIRVRIETQSTAPNAGNQSTYIEIVAPVAVGVPASATSSSATGTTS